MYHVSLKKIIPTRSLTELPQLGLMMSNDLSIREQNQAARVLWWIEQFFTSDQPRIENDRLVDKQGSRGPQEPNTYILSKKALGERKKSLEQQDCILKGEIDELEEKWNKENEKYQIWNADVHKVKEAEAFLSTKAEQEYRVEQLEKLKDVHQRLQNLKKELKREADEVWKKGHSWAEEIKSRQDDLFVYEQFGQQSEQIELLQQLEKTSKNIKNEIATIRRSMKKIEEELDDLQQQIRKNQRTAENLEDKANQNQRDISRISKEVRNII